MVVIEAYLGFRVKKQIRRIVEVRGRLWEKGEAVQTCGWTVERRLGAKALKHPAGIVDPLLRKAGEDVFVQIVYEPRVKRS